MQRGEQRKMKWAKLSGPRRKLPPREGFYSLHHLQVQTPKQKAKYSAVDSFQVLPCRPLTDTHLLHSGQHNRTTSHPYSSFTCLSKLCQKRHGFCQILSAQKAPPRHFPGDREQPHRALDTFTLPVEAPNLYIMHATS